MLTAVIFVVGLGNRDCDYRELYELLTHNKGVATMNLDDRKCFLVFVYNRPLQRRPPFEFRAQIRIIRQEFLKNVAKNYVVLKNF